MIHGAGCLSYVSCEYYTIKEERRVDKIPLSLRVMEADTISFNPD
tara:strand:- start:2039 stop:2173 length:135 start_codon:yes stop_codon:yes gene_type:complete